MLVEALVGALLGLVAVAAVVVLVLRRSPGVFVAETLAETLQRGPESDVDEDAALDEAFGREE